MNRFTFIFESDGTNLVKEFIVKEDASTEEILEAFGAFLVLCGQAYNDESIN